MSDQPQLAASSPGDDGPPLPDEATEALLRAAVEHQQAGDHDSARTILADVLARDPENPDALHLMGIARFAEGRVEEGAALVDRAVARAPGFTMALGNLADMLRQMGRPAEALAALRRAVARTPDHPVALAGLGYGLLRQGDAAAAAEQFLKAVQIDPDNAIAHAGLGTARLRQQRFHEAEASLRQALGLRPAEPEIHMNLGLTLRMLRKLDEAIGSLRVALLLRPAYAPAQLNLGLVLLERGRPGEALDMLRAAAASDPAMGEAHFAVGQVLRGQGDAAGAAASLRRAVETLANPAPAYAALDQVLRSGQAPSTGRQAEERVALERTMAERAPAGPAQRVRLARALASAGRLEEAVAECEAVLAENPAAADARGSIAAIRYVQGRYDEARADFAAVLEAVPGEPAARTTLAMMQLADGDFASGLPAFEARFDLPQLAAFRPAGNRLPPLSLAPDVSGKRILLAAEQGQGDTIQFVRYARLLAERGANVLLEVQAPLVPLLSAMPGLAGVTAQGSAAPACDYTCPMMSLPLVFGTDIETIPAAVPYLSVPADRGAAWRARLGAGAGRRRIALCWSGNPGFTADRFRSIPLELFRPLLEDGRLAIHLVQTDIREGDDALVAAHPGVVDLRRELTDFADTAAVLDQMDLVISVDTAVAHLAGALGRPSWILLPFGADWRWLQDRNDSPWYPTARLFRQPAMDAWQPVLDAVRGALAR